MYGIDYVGRFGFASVADWLDSVFASFPDPWSICPLEGKYYGTRIMDARGVPILSVWESSGEPSAREKAQYGEDWTPESWAEYCCDSHWESETALNLAGLIVSIRGTDDCYGDVSPSLAPLIIRHGRWAEYIFAEVACGGPNRRRIESPAFDEGARK